MAVTDRRPPAFADLARPPLRSQVYRALLSAIVSGEYAPGERVIDLELARQMGVSRTPVREALQRLATEGLVEIRPGSFTRISPLSPADADIFPIVAELHVLAVRFGVPRLTAADISRMKEINSDMRLAAEGSDVFQAMELDTKFHNVLVIASGNTELSKLIANLEPKIRRLEFDNFRNSRQASIHVHEEIIAACAAHDRETAERLVRENWLGLGESLRNALSSAAPSDEDKA